MMRDIVRGSLVQTPDDYSIKKYSVAMRFLSEAEIPGFRVRYCCSAISFRNIVHLGFWASSSSIVLFCITSKFAGVMACILSVLGLPVIKKNRLPAYPVETENSMWCHCHQQRYKGSEYSGLYKSNFTVLLVFPYKNHPYSAIWIQRAELWSNFFCAKYTEALKIGCNHCYLE